MRGKQFDFSRTIRVEIMRNSHKYGLHHYFRTIADIMKFSFGLYLIFINSFSIWLWIFIDWLLFFGLGGVSWLIFILLFALLFACFWIVVWVIVFASTCLATVYGEANFNLTSCFHLNIGLIDLNFLLEFVLLILRFQIIYFRIFFLRLFILKGFSFVFWLSGVNDCLLLTNLTFILHRLIYWPWWIWLLLLLYIWLTLLLYLFLYTLLIFWLLCRI